MHPARSWWFAAFAGVFVLAACAPGAAEPPPAAPGPEATQPFAACGPRQTGSRVVHPARIATVHPAVSPPARSLPPATAAASSTRIIPIGRIKPWHERCPPPPQTGSDQLPSSGSKSSATELMQ